MRVVICVLAGLVAGCATVPPPMPVSRIERPLLRYEPLGEPVATVIAVHGLNDRKAAFLPFGAQAAAAGIRVIAYDQGGFGANPDAGQWPGQPQLEADLHAAIEDARRLAPDRPVFVLGESMGAAVAIAALDAPNAPPVDGLILAAPAVWGGDRLNPLLRAALWLTATVAPDLDLSARGLDILASDNIPMLRALGSDPLYLPTARAATVRGVVRLMDDALKAAPQLHGPRLVLVGARDEVVPTAAFDAFAARLRPEDCLFVRYPEGWHLLLRDLGRDAVINDVIAWIGDQPLPSGQARACPTPVS